MVPPNSITSSPDVVVEFCDGICQSVHPSQQFLIDLTKFLDDPARSNGGVEQYPVASFHVHSVDLFHPEELVDGADVPCYFTHGS